MQQYNIFFYSQNYSNFGIIWPNLYDYFLTKLNRHKQKQIFLAGDTNIDLIKYERDQNSINLINTANTHGYVQLIARPTRITDHMTP